MDEHSIDTQTCERFDGVQDKRKRIGNLDFDTASHCVYHLTVHAIFCTKFRRHTLNPARRDFLDRALREIALNCDCEVIEFGSDEDHIHFLLRYPPTVVLTSIIGTLQSKSASALLDKFGSVYWGRHKRTFWSSGFFLCSVGGATLEILKQYIENQGTR